MESKERVGGKNPPRSGGGLTAYRTALQSDHQEANCGQTEESAGKLERVMSQGGYELPTGLWTTSCKPVTEPRCVYGT